MITLLKLKDSVVLRGILSHEFYRRKLYFKRTIELNDILTRKIQPYWKAKLTDAHFAVPVISVQFTIIFNKAEFTQQFHEMKTLQTRIT